MIGHPSRGDHGKSKIRRVSDGLVMERAAPDASGMVACGEFEYVPASTPSVVDRVEALGTRGMRELLGLPDGAASRASMVRTLVPMVEAGDVELPE